MILILLVIVNTLLFMTVFFVHRGEFIHPSVVICAGFLLSEMAALCNMNRWSLSLQWNTFFVIIVGQFMFVCVGEIINLYYKRSKPEVIVRNDFTNNYNEIKVENWKCNLLLIVVAVISVLYIYEVRSIVYSYKGNISWTSMMNWYRNYVMYGRVSDRISVWLEQSHQMLVFAEYIYIYILVHNYIFTKNINKKLLLIAIVTMFSVFIDSSRKNVLVFFIEIIIVAFLLNMKKNNMQLRYDNKFLRKCILGLVLVCLGFILVKPLVGRMDNRDPFYYITYYLGQSIPNLNVFLQEKHAVSTVWGKETFYGLNHALLLITGKEKYNYIEHKEFRYVGGVTTGNVYTVFRAYINDFGYVGYAILTLIFSFVINFLYCHVKKRMVYNYNIVDFSLILFCYLDFSVWCAFFANFFYRFIISLNIIKFTIAIWFWNLFLTRLKIRWKGGYSYEKGNNVWNV